MDASLRSRHGAGETLPTAATPAPAPRVVRRKGSPQQNDTYCAFLLLAGMALGLFAFAWIGLKISDWDIERERIGACVRLRVCLMVRSSSNRPRRLVAVPAASTVLTNRRSRRVSSRQLKWRGKRAAAASSCRRARSHPTKRPSQAGTRRTARSRSDRVKSPTGRVSSPPARSPAVRSLEST